MDENKNKNRKNENKDEEIEKAKKEMEELMKSIQEEMGNKNVKVVKVEIPKPTFKNFLFSLIVSLLINILLIIGTSGYIDIFQYDYIIDLLYFAIYFTIVERVINYIFVKLFMTLVIKSMGLASLIPYVISIAIVLIFPLFVNVKNLFISLIMIVFILVCKNKILSLLRNKLILKKVRKNK